MAAILDSLVGSCAKKMQEMITEEAVLILGVEEDLKELQRTMTQIQCFLNDAEKRRIKESAVNNWLGELRDAMYYADDIIDMARSEGRMLLAERPSSSRESTKCGGISFFTCIPNVPKRHKIAVKIRDFNAELEKISKLGERFLGLQSLQPKAEVTNVKRTTNLVEPNLVGKETLHACKRLVKNVLGNKEKKAYKVGIVGTGGIGKTTLAQKIYNGKRLEGAFSKKAWICVSQEYSEVALLKEILRNFAVHYEQDETEGELSSKLAAAVTDKSFFLVLDDVWQPGVWTNLLRIPLHAAATGVILVTTRHDTVAHAIGMEYVHRVDLMSADVGWELLWKSMNLNEEKDVEKLRDMGFDIVRKCGGLPLAIKVTARVLATKEKTENGWRKFIDGSAWSVDNLPTELRGALYLSYDDLPSHLKQCFLYCALYPEDGLLYRDYLVMHWVAEGFIEQQQGQLMEDTAEEYYYELINRNLLQPNGTTVNHVVCKMHDLLRQLACYLSREECFIGDPESLGVINISRLRRLTAVTKADSAVLPSMDKGEFKLRTFNTDQKPWSVDETFFKRFPYIRVLNLSDSLVHSIPDYIRNMIHLRLLDLDGTDISGLPESISSLMNLQILNLSRCKDLHSLPLAVTRLCNLRRLGLADTPINQVPKGIGRLEFLNDLENFPVGAGGDNGKIQDGWKLEELAHLSQLRRLHMTRLERATPYSTDSLLTEKKHLKVLNLFCTEHTDEPYSEEDVTNIEKIFEQLIPPHNLEDLFITRFFGRRYPTWLGTTHLASVIHLILIDCNSCVHLPPLGQLPNLRYLRIDRAAAVTKIGPEFVGCRGANRRSTDAVVAFPKLESLFFWNMPKWEEWSFVAQGDADAAEGGEDGSIEIQKGEAPSPGMQLLPCLKKLGLRGCPKLGSLPRQLGQEATSLKELHLRGASCLKVVEDLPFLSENLLIEGCGDLERVSNLPQVGILHVARCPDLRCVEGLGNLQHLWLDEGMEELSSLWIPGLQQQHKELHGEDLDVYDWK
ncbi:putative disease resistance protein RGA3 [Lolium rigidum]|uniref:putative disease resistance protein RGA3 n=1 Tax=Lolium rigidum TaxID=89674 RepID=UPI001F5D5AC8|nr:putative disease resistance protein RGA3 [Lolium rigidum]